MCIPYCVLFLTLCPRSVQGDLPASDSAAEMAMGADVVGGVSGMRSHLTLDWHYLIPAVTVHKDNTPSADGGLVDPPSSPGESIPCNIFHFQLTSECPQM